MSVFSVTKHDFTQRVLHSDKPVLVDFWAPWCGPCRMLSPVVEQIAQEHPEVSVCKVNIDDEPGLAQQYGVMAVPTLLVFRSGKLSANSVGVRPKAELEGLLK